MSCPIEIVHSGTTLNALSLFTLLTSITNSTHEHPLLFRHDDTEFRLDFHPSLSVITPDEIHKRSTQPSSFCHFRATNERGFRAWLSACDPDRIEMIIRAPNENFRLDNTNGTFGLVSDGQDDCDLLWKSVVKRGSGNGLMIHPLSPFPEHARPPYFDKYNHLFMRRRYVEFAMFGEYSLFEKYDKDEEKTKNRMLDVLHFTNSLFDALNIEIQLVHLKVFDSPNIIDYSNSSRIWRSFESYLESNYDGAYYDHVHLMISKDPEHGTKNAGESNGHSMCVRALSLSWIHENDESPNVVHKLAHELGHSIGMGHDREEDIYSVCECASECCVMGANDEFPALHWSNCSLEDLEIYYKNGADYCMWNKPGETLDSMCGNGVVDEQEDCDCGPWGCITHDCCDMSTCKFREQAECAFGSCCDLTTCSVNKNGSICRGAITPCDVPEFCDGEHLECPDDSFIADGLKCPDDPDAICFQGRCGSRKLQCKEIYGDKSFPAEESCYENNLDESGCGRHTESSNMACAPEDVLCGNLYCTTPTGEASILANGWIVEAGTGGECMRPFYKAPDGYDGEYFPGITHDGTSCGHGKYCRKTKCVSKTELFGCDLDVFYDDSKCEDGYYCEKPLQSDTELLHCDQGSTLQAEIHNGDEFTWIDVSSASCIYRKFEIAFETEDGVKMSEFAVGFRCVREWNPEYQSIDEEEANNLPLQQRKNGETEGSPET